MLAPWLSSALVGVFTHVSVPALQAADDAAVDKLLANIRWAYSKVSSVSQRTACIFTSSKGQSQTIVVDLSYSKVNLVSATISLGPRISGIVTCDGKTVATSSGGKVTKRQAFSAEALSAAIPANVETVGYFDFKRQFSRTLGGAMQGSKLSVINSEAWNKKSWHVLEEVSERNKVRARYFVDPTSFLVERTVAYPLGSDQAAMDFRVMRRTLGAKIDPKIFVVPPKS